MVYIARRLDGKPPAQAGSAARGLGLWGQLSSGLYTGELVEESTGGRFHAERDGRLASHEP